MKPKTITLNYGERIVGVVPEHVNGPGWANQPVWVYIGTNDGRLREECIQPNERTAAMQSLFMAGEAMCTSLLLAVPVKKLKRN